MVVIQVKRGVDMAKKEQTEYIWKDRKRILGLPITFTRYRIVENRLFFSKGLFNTIEDEMLLYRILDLKLNRTLGDKIVGVGSVILYTADKSNPTLTLERIKNPTAVRDTISKMVEAERLKLNIRGKEMFGVADTDNSVMGGTDSDN